MNKTCEICGTSFGKPKNISKREWKLRRFCNRKCKAKWDSKRMVGNNYGFKKGMIPWNKGKHPKYVQGENNPSWKGENVGYNELHQWVSRHRGKPDTCEICGKNNLSKYNIHWANKSGKYKRDLKDWIRLCVSCHKKLPSRDSVK